MTALDNTSSQAAMALEEEGVDGEIDESLEELGNTSSGRSGSSATLPHPHKHSHRNRSRHRHHHGSHHRQGEEGELYQSDQDARSGRPQRRTAENGAPDSWGRSSHRKDRSSRPQNNSNNHYHRPRPNPADDMNELGEIIEPNEDPLIQTSQMGTTKQRDTLETGMCEEDDEEAEDGEILEEGELHEEESTKKAGSKVSPSKSASRAERHRRKSDHKDRRKRDHEEKSRRKKHSDPDKSTESSPAPAWGSGYQAPRPTRGSSLPNKHGQFGRRGKGYHSPPGLYDSPSYSEESDHEMSKSLLTEGYIDASVAADEQEGIFNMKVSLGSKKKSADRKDRKRSRNPEGKSLEGPPRKKPLVDMAMADRPICKFYMDGKCAKGSGCQFNHDVEKPRKMEVCKYHLTVKGCIKPRCLFMHQDFPCKYYHTGATCYSGDRCKFSHEPLTEDTRRALEMRVDAEDIIDMQEDYECDYRPRDSHSKQSLLGSPPRFRHEVKKIPSLFDIEVHPPCHPQGPPSKQSPQAVRPSGFYNEAAMSPKSTVSSGSSGTNPNGGMSNNPATSQPGLTNPGAGGGLLQTPMRPNMAGNRPNMMMGMQQGPQQQRPGGVAPLQFMNPGQINNQQGGPNLPPVLNMLGAIIREAAMQKGPVVPNGNMNVGHNNNMGPANLLKNIQNNLTQNILGQGSISQPGNLMMRPNLANSMGLLQNMMNSNNNLAANMMGNNNNLAANMMGNNNMPANMMGNNNMPANMMGNNNMPANMIGNNMQTHMMGNNNSLAHNMMGNNNLTHNMMGNSSLGNKMMGNKGPGVSTGNLGLNDLSGVVPVSSAMDSNKIVNMGQEVGMMDVDYRIKPQFGDVTMEVRQEERQQPAADEHKLIIDTQVRGQENPSEKRTSTPPLSENEQCNKEAESSDTCSSDREEVGQQPVDVTPAGPQPVDSPPAAQPSVDMVPTVQSSVDMIPAGLPKTQRQLFKRIQQQQLLREKEQTKLQAQKVAGESHTPVADDDWYSSDDDGEDEHKPKLTDVLKTLNQQPAMEPVAASTCLPSPMNGASVTTTVASPLTGASVTTTVSSPAAGAGVLSSGSSTFNIMQMINAIKSQSTSKPATESAPPPPSLGVSSSKNSAQDKEVFLSSPASPPPPVFTAVKKLSNPAFPNLYLPELTVDPPVVSATPNKTLVYCMDKISLNLQKPYSKLPDHINAHDVTFKDDPRVKWHLQHLDKQVQRVAPQRKDSNDGERPQKPIDPRLKKGPPPSDPRLKNVPSDPRLKGASSDPRLNKEGDSPSSRDGRMVDPRLLRNPAGAPATANAAVQLPRVDPRLARQGVGANLDPRLSRQNSQNNPEGMMASGINNIGAGPLNNMGQGPINSMGPGPIHNIGPGPISNMGLGPLNNMGVGPINNMAAAMGNQMGGAINNMGGMVNQMSHGFNKGFLY